ncbi:MAG: hypothetical protein ACTSQI_16345 [Candidatus Helarchaeota archaeon]
MRHIPFADVRSIQTRKTLSLLQPIQNPLIMDLTEFSLNRFGQTLLVL